MKQTYFFSITLILLFISAVLPVAAQRSDVQEWPKGLIVLTSGDTLSGPISYYRTEDIIRITLADGTVNAYAPVNVSSFTVADEKNINQQTFRPYLWNRGNDYSDYKAPAFFELLKEGKYTLVKREMQGTRNMGASPMYAGYGRYYDSYNYGPRYQTVVIDLFYLYTPDNKIKALRNTKRDLEDLFGNKEKIMSAYIKENKLQYTSARDLTKIIDYYNSLF